VHNFLLLSRIENEEWNVTMFCDATNLRQVAVFAFQFFLIVEFFARFWMNQSNWSSSLALTIQQMKKKKKNATFQGTFHTRMLASSDPESTNPAS
jgi:hypothetical protein